MQHIIARKTQNNKPQISCQILASVGASDVGDVKTLILSFIAK